MTCMPDDHTHSGQDDCTHAMFMAHAYLCPVKMITPCNVYGTRLSFPGQDRHASPVCDNKNGMWLWCTLANC